MVASSRYYENAARGEFTRRRRVGGKRRKAAMVSEDCRRCTGRKRTVIELDDGPHRTAPSQTGETWSFKAADCSLAVNARHHHAISSPEPSFLEPVLKEDYGIILPNCVREWLRAWKRAIAGLA